MIKVSDLWAEVKEVAAENPDFVYRSIGGKCVYESDGEPSCLVGHALFRLGVPASQVASFNECGAIGLVIDANASVFGEMRADADEWEYRELLAMAQAYQDGQLPWGQAVAHAERVMS